MNSEVICTIILIVYNHEKYLRQAIDSIVSQKTGYSYEVLIHDDASTDSCRTIIEEYAEKYHEIIKFYFEEKNQFSSTGNICTTDFLDEISGKYVMFLEGDDYWISDYKIQQQIDFLENNEEYTGCAGYTQLFDCESQKFSEIDKKDLKEFTLVMQDFVNRVRSFHTSTVCYKREVIFGIYYDFIKDGLQASDLILLCSATCGNNKVYVMPTIMSVYRWHSSPTSFTMLNQDRRLQMLHTLRSYSDFNKYTDFEYYNLTLIGMDNAYFEIYGYTLRDLVRSKWLKREFMKYSLIHKCGQLYRMIVKRQRVNVYS